MVGHMSTFSGLCLLLLSCDGHLDIDCFRPFCGLEECVEKPSAGSDRLERQSAFPNSLELEHEHDYAWGARISPVPWQWV